MYEGHPEAPCSVPRVQNRILVLSFSVSQKLPVLSQSQTPWTNENALQTVSEFFTQTSSSKITHRTRQSIRKCQLKQRKSTKDENYRNENRGKKWSLSPRYSCVSCTSTKCACTCTCLSACVWSLVSSGRTDPVSWELLFDWVTSSFVLLIHTICTTQSCKRFQATFVMLLCSCIANSLCLHLKSKQQ